LAARSIQLVFRATLQGFFPSIPVKLVFRIRFPKSVKILWRNASFHPFRAFLIVDTIRLAKRMGVFLSTLVELCERNNSIE
jgi:hypothetical protein